LTNLKGYLKNIRARRKDWWFRGRKFFIKKEFILL
jgi:hypothetical protein